MNQFANDSLESTSFAGSDCGEYNKALEEADSLGLDDDQYHVSLAYYDLDVIPSQVIQYLAEKTQTLDLSNNELKNLSFLASFKNLHTLVLDRNPNPNASTFPTMPKLEILWLNNCNIINVNEWLYTLQTRCPALKQLSMMSNPVGATTLNGVTEVDELEYKRAILRILPNLIYFDGSFVTDKQRTLLPKKRRFVSLLGRIFTDKLNIISHISF